jgi:hypothetical protein
MHSVNSILFTNIFNKYSKIMFKIIYINGFSNFIIKNAKVKFQNNIYHNKLN